MAETPKTPRRITELAVSTGTDGGPDVVFAACDDGTVWRLVDDQLKKNEWTLLPTIPGTWVARRGQS